MLSNSDYRLIVLFPILFLCHNCLSIATELTGFFCQFICVLSNKEIQIEHQRIHFLLILASWLVDEIIS